MRADIDGYLDFESDADLRAALKIAIIEDVARLEGVTWKQARTRYDEWAWDVIKQNPKFDPSWEISKFEEKVGHIVGNSPNLEFFIFADTASVDSVVDCVDTEAPGAYFFMLVATGLKRTRIFSVDDDGNIIEDDEEDEEAKFALKQTFKMNDFVMLFASCVQNNWPNSYDRKGDCISRFI